MMSNCLLFILVLISLVVRPLLNKTAIHVFHLITSFNLAKKKKKEKEKVK